ncbi:MAG TPA: carboxypeptidase-like regulatory domain-containing protein [Planctomycetota bacterium]|nr:carboxypeptidase-like regulatory domain-containing protein [Planctomycetota bacterium]
MRITSGTLGRTLALVAACAAGCGKNGGDERSATAAATKPPTPAQAPAPSVPRGPESAAPVEGGAAAGRPSASKPAPAPTGPPTIAGRVVSAASGAAVVGATVALFDGAGAVVKEASCDAEGRFVLETAKPLRDAAVRAIAPQYAAVVSALFDLPPKGRVDLPDFALVRGVPIRGRLVLETGAPVAGGTVRLEPALRLLDAEDVAPTLELIRYRPPIATATTAPDGRFEMLAPPTGAWVAVGLAKGRAPDASDPIRPSADRDPPEITLTLGPSRRLEGSVDSEGKHAVSGAVVSLLRTNADEPWGVRVARAVTDEDGWFAFDDVDPHAVLVVAESRGLPPHFRWFTPDVLSVQVSLGCQAMLHGTVVDAKGRKPLAGVRLATLSQRGGFGVAVAETDAEGRFKLACAPGEEFWITLRKDGFAVPTDGDSVRAFLRTGSVFVDKLAAGAVVEKTFVMRGGASASGAVRAVDGGPVAGAVVKAVQYRAFTGPTVVATATTRDDGSFLFKGLPEGRVRFIAAKDGWRAPRASEDAPEAFDFGGAFKDRFPWNLDADVPVIDVVLNLARGRDVNGVVLGDGGKPAPRAEVRARRSPRDADEFLDVPPESVVADAEGRFTLRGLPPEATTVEATHAAWPGGAAAQAPAGDSAANGVTLTLAAGGGLSGVARYPDGAPAAGVRLFFVSGDAAPPNRRADEGPFRRSARVDQEGRYRFERLAPGPGRLLLADDNEDLWTRERAVKSTREDRYFLADAERAVVVAERAEATRDLKLLAPTSISGEVVAADGTPVPWAPVWAQLVGDVDDPAPDVEGFRRRSKWSDRQGRFRLDGLKPDAKYRLMTMAGGDAPSFEDEDEGDPAGGERTVSTGPVRRDVRDAVPAGATKVKLVIK